MPTADHCRLRAAEAEARHQLAHAEDIATANAGASSSASASTGTSCRTLNGSSCSSSLLDATPFVIRMQSRTRLRDIAAEASGPLAWIEQLVARAYDRAA